MVPHLAARELDLVRQWAGGKNMGPKEVRAALAARHKRQKKTAPNIKHVSRAMQVKTHLEMSTLLFAWGF